MKKRVLLKVLVLTTLFVGCTEKFEEINTPQDSTSIVEAGIFFTSLLNNPLRNYQRNVNLYPDLYSQYWANVNDGFESPRYEYVDGWIGNQWNEFYTQTLPEANQLSIWYGENL